MICGPCDTREKTSSYDKALEKMEECYEVGCTEGFIRCLKS